MFPCAKDKTWDKIHPGYSTIEAITFTKWSWFQKWTDLPWKNRGRDYEKEKNKLSKRILKIVCKHVPSIKGSIDYLELSTPVTIKDLANYQRGEMYGIDHSF